MVFKKATEFELLEVLEEEPQMRQVDLAARLGVAVGTVNWHLKRFASKGYIKVKRIERRQWGYTITPKGMAQKARLSMSHIRTSMSLYREVRERSRSLLQQVKESGYKEVILEGEGDLLDICKLTCLEQGVHPLSGQKKNDVPVLRADGVEIVLQRGNGSLSRRTDQFRSDTIKEITKRIVRASSPEKIILFGSYAHGTAEEDSDVDILVIQRGVQSRLKEYTKIRRSLKGMKFPFDIIIVTPEEFEFYSANWQNSIIAEARDRGIVLHES
jgi:predicted nucleotidyltransferase/DNA-binding MarR family transcriptional regulator